MAIRFDRETIEKLRAMPPREAIEQARRAVFQSGSVGSEDFLDIYSQLVEEDVLTWDQVNAFDG